MYSSMFPKDNIQYIVAALKFHWVVEDHMLFKLLRVFSVRYCIHLVFPSSVLSTNSIPHETFTNVHK